MRAIDVLLPGCGWTHHSKLCGRSLHQCCKSAGFGTWFGVVISTPIWSPRTQRNGLYWRLIRGRDPSCDRSQQKPRDMALRAAGIEAPAVSWRTRACRDERHDQLPVVKHHATASSDRSIFVSALVFCEKGPYFIHVLIVYSYLLWQSNIA